MFTLTGHLIRNSLFDARLHDRAQLPAQLTFCPAQFAPKRAQFSFFSRTLSECLCRVFILNGTCTVTVSLTVHLLADSSSDVQCAMYFV